MALWKQSGYDGTHANLLSDVNFQRDLFFRFFHSSTTILCDKLDCASNVVVRLYDTDIPFADGMWWTSWLLHDYTTVVYLINDDHRRDDAHDVKRNAAYK